MFVFSENLTFWWPVKPIEPDPDNPGQLLERSFEVLFEQPTPEVTEHRRKTRAALLEAILKKGISDDEYSEAQSALETFDDEVAEATVKDWRKIGDQNGKDLPFSMFPRIYKFERVRTAILRAYEEAISQDKARLGN